jgi:allophanate hydrolase
MRRPASTSSVRWRCSHGIGAVAVPIDYAPFAEAARMLYEGPWVAERLAAIKAFIGEHPDALLPLTRGIIEHGSQYSAVDAFEAAYRLQALKRRCDAALAGIDALLLPTAERSTRWQRSPLHLWS